MISIACHKDIFKEQILTELNKAINVCLFRIRIRQIRTIYASTIMSLSIQWGRSFFFRSRLMFDSAIDRLSTKAIGHFFAATQNIDDGV